MKNEYKVLLENPEGRRPLRDIRCGRKFNKKKLS